jgi:hypothetical protein
MKTLIRVNRRVLLALCASLAVSLGTAFAGGATCGFGAVYCGCSVTVSGCTWCEVSGCEIYSTGCDCTCWSCLGGDKGCEGECPE